MSTRKRKILKKDLTPDEQRIYDHLKKLIKRAQNIRLSKEMRDEIFKNLRLETAGAKVIEAFLNNMSHLHHDAFTKLEKDHKGRIFNAPSDLALELLQHTEISFSLKKKILAVIKPHIRIKNIYPDVLLREDEKEFRNELIKEFPYYFFSRSFVLNKSEDLEIIYSSNKFWRGFYTLQLNIIERFLLSIDRKNTAAEKIALVQSLDLKDKTWDEKAATIFQFLFNIISSNPKMCAKNCNIFTWAKYRISSKFEPIFWNTLPDDLAMELISHNAALIKGIPKKYLKHKYCLVAAKKSATAIRYIPEEFRSREVCKIASKKSASALQYVPEQFLDSRDVLFHKLKGKNVNRVIEKIMRRKQGG